MTTHPTIGIISPGDMRHALGAVLVQHGRRVLTSLQGRSPRTAVLARQAGITDVGDDATLVRETDILLSVLVPAQAHAFAERIAAAMRATHSTRCLPTAMPSPLGTLIFVADQLPMQGKPGRDLSIEQGQEVACATIGVAELPGAVLVELALIVEGQEAQRAKGKRQ